ncbi:hypothetical protein CH330_01280 [candidate division WOR-3 bacterium JGI_Cruoil_03_51_56]|uniref:Uncharacterized protein n=1 Tax=candidate division WOR-3 bacterium JGI_Cruoil_03_51_56 TaxID=1973747 RepID=A0A235BX40_UNCW3|nr:MAG: hypothetical protein CH330_01280 [candidate division WOR-3 bacterium JGI_Cruoil_03_51_56]
MPTIHRSYLGQAAIASSLFFFLEDPKKYWWLGILIGAGVILIVDDLIYFMSDGKYCLLCSVIPPPGYEGK